MTFGDWPKCEYCGEILDVEPSIEDGETWEFDCPDCGGRVRVTQHVDRFYTSEGLRKPVDDIDTALESLSRRERDELTEARMLVCDRYRDNCSTPGGKPCPHDTEKGCAFGGMVWPDPTSSVRVLDDGQNQKLTKWVNCIQEGPQ